MSENSTQEDRFEITLGMLIAVFAAILAVIDIFASKFGDDEMVAISKKISAYELYHGKILKETLIKGEKDMLSDLLLAGAIVTKDEEVFQKTMKRFDKELELISKQKEEILVGSKKLGKDHWVQPDKNGRMGNIKGAEEWETQVDQLALAGDKFDLAILFMQMCLLMGAIDFLSRNKTNRQLFFTLMIIFGILGSIYGLWGYLQARG